MQKEKENPLHLQWNELLLNNTAMVEAEFEALVILSMSLPQNESYSGLFITAMLTFGQEIDAETYEQTWNLLSNNSQKLLDWKVGESEVSMPDKCSQVSELKDLMPKDIWDESGLDPETTPTMGTTLDVKCPDHLQLSQDNDGFNDSDGKFTILCSTRKVFNAPKKMEEWPTCVKSCPRRLPYIPVKETTGLVRVDSTSTIPSGQKGKYMCEDTNLGLERVSLSSIFIRNGTFFVERLRVFLAKCTEVAKKGMQVFKPWRHLRGFCHFVISSAFSTTIFVKNDPLGPQEPLEKVPGRYLNI